MFRRTRQGAVNVISGADPLNGEQAEDLSRVIEECLGEGQPRAVLDLQDIPLIDSAGLELLLELQENFEQRAGILKLAAPSMLCEDILNATGVADRFEIYRDLKTAVGSFLQ